jgi:hypothetical protein
MCWSIRWACCSRWWSIRLTSMTVSGPTWWWGRSDPTCLPRLHHSWADQGSAGALRQWTREHLGSALEVAYPGWRQLQRYFPDLLDNMGFHPGFHVLPRRWVVERMCAWLGRSRRLRRDYARLPTRSEALISLLSHQHPLAAPPLGVRRDRNPSRTVSRSQPWLLSCRGLLD